MASICKFPILSPVSPQHPTSNAPNTGSLGDSEDAWDILGIYKLCRTSSFEEMFCCLISFNITERKGDEKGKEGRGWVGNSHTARRPPSRPASQQTAAGRNESQTSETAPNHSLTVGRHQTGPDHLHPLSPGISPIYAQASLTPAGLSDGKSCSWCHIRPHSHLPHSSSEAPTLSLLPPLPSHSEPQSCF